MSVERRWNRNEVSRESPDKEVNRRPTSLKQFRADALRGAKGLNCDQLEYEIRRKGGVLRFLPDYYYYCAKRRRWLVTEDDQFLIHDLLFLPISTIQSGVS